MDNKFISIESQQLLLRVMNDSPTIVKLNETKEWEITALKPAVKWMIAEEAAKIKQSQPDTMNVAIAMATNMPCICRCLTLALLNDKKRIEEEYDIVFELLFFETDDKHWGNLFLEVLRLLDTDAFFLNISLVEMFLNMTTQRKMTKKEAEQLPPEQNTDK
mgnify:CR=1 FL=1